MTDFSLKWLQHWYLDQCDGDWEHQFGVRIDTLDNPGWSVQIDLVETPLSDETFNTIDHQRSANDWIYCRVQKEKFEGSGGPQNLEEILDVFRKWAEGVEARRETFPTTA
jgi:Immunity protein 53